eukprot:5546620-Pyramimonas_sp.AAC.1
MKDGVTLGQGEYIEQLRLIQPPELTGASAGAKASNMANDMIVCLRGALAYAVIAQVRFEKRPTCKCDERTRLPESCRLALRRSPVNR